MKDFWDKLMAAVPIDQQAAIVSGWHILAQGYEDRKQHKQRLKADKQPRGRS